MSRRRRPLGPLQQRRVAFGILVAACALAGIGAYLRTVSAAGSQANRWLILESIGLLVAAGAAVWQARIAERLVQFNARQVRRVAIFSLLAGVMLLLLGCVFPSAAESDRLETAVNVMSEVAIVGGVGLGLSGLFTLMWAFGLNYAGGRIEQLSDEEW